MSKDTVFDRILYMPMIKLTKNEMISLYRGLHAVGNLSGPRFVYVVARNRDYLQKEVDAIQKSLEPYENFQEFEEKRVELAKKHAKEDEEGNPVVIGKGNQSKFDIEDQEAFDKELEKLKEEYQEAIDEREKQQEEFNDSMEDEIELLLLELKQEDLPEEITANQLSALIPILKTDDSQ